MKDWEDVKIERNVDAELKTQIYQQLDIIENGLPNCTPDDRKKLELRLKELREVYDAYFADFDQRMIVVSDEELPAHVQRAQKIISTLEDDNEE